MKKLFQINSTLNVGSTGRIAENMGLLAKEKGWVSYIAYGRAKGETQSYDIRIGGKLDIWNHLLQTRLFDKHGFASKRATKNLIKEIENIQPDVIHLHNLHGYYINIELLFSFLKRYQKPIFWTLYDCWAFTGHCAYFDMKNCNKWKTECYQCPNKSEYPKSVWVDNSKKNYLQKKSILQGIDNLTLIVNSNWLKGNVKQSILSEYHVEMIHNGINLSDFYPEGGDQRRSQLNLDNKYIILGIANVWDNRKGLADFIKLSNKLEKDEIIVLDGLKSSQMKNLPKNIMALDRAKSIKELVALYSMADVFVNPTWEDNFPTTNLEALACGTPVVTYASGGSPEAINEKTGFVVKRGDVDELILKIRKLKNKGKKVYFEECSNRAKNEFDYIKNYNKFIELFEKKIKKSE